MLAGLPLDVVRVRQQIDLSSSRHLVAQMLSMIRVEGPATLLRGATYPLATITLQVGLCTADAGGLQTVTLQRPLIGKLQACIAPRCSQASERMHSALRAAHTIWRSAASLL